MECGTCGSYTHNTMGCKAVSRVYDPDEARECKKCKALTYSEDAKYCFACGKKL